MPGSWIAPLIVLVIIGIFASVLSVAIYQARKVQRFWNMLPAYGFKPVLLPDAELQDRLSNLMRGAEALNLYVNDQGDYRIYLFQAVQPGSQNNNTDGSLTAAIESPSMDLPKIILIPDLGNGLLAGAAERFIGFALDKDLVHTELPEFEKQYTLYTAFPLEARGFFTEARSNRLAANPRNWLIQAAGDLLVFSRVSMEARPKDEELFLQRVKEDAAELYLIFAYL